MGRYIFCLVLFLSISFSKAQKGAGPKAIRNFYDIILNDLNGRGKDINLIKETYHEDWTIKPYPPNPACKGAKCGPGQDLSAFPGVIASIMPDFYVERQYTLMCSNSYICGDKVAMLSKVGGTVTNLPPGLKEFPIFPGIDPNRIIGKKCETMAIDIQIIKDGRVKRTWHFEDWTACLAQLLGETQQLFMNPREDPGELLTEIPESIKNFYDKVLQDPLGQGQNETLINSIFNPDWNVRVNNLNPTRPGPGTGPNGNQKIFGLLGTFIPNLKFERQHILLCGDHVAALSKVTGTITNTMPPGFDQIPLMPGIDPKRLLGKSFTTLALDIHMIKNKKLKHAWHIEDWQTAAYQILNGTPAPDLGLDESFLSEKNY